MSLVRCRCHKDCMDLVCKCSKLGIKTLLIGWICSDQRNMWHYTQIAMSQQEVKAMKIVIPSFIQQWITTVLLDCTRRAEINI